MAARSKAAMCDASGRMRNVGRGWRFRIRKEAFDRAEATSRPEPRVTVAGSKGAAALLLPGQPYAIARQLRALPSFLAQPPGGAGYRLFGYHQEVSRTASVWYLSRPAGKGGGSRPPPLDVIARLDKVETETPGAERMLISPITPEELRRIAPELAAKVRGGGARVAVSGSVDVAPGEFGLAPTRVELECAPHPGVSPDAAGSLVAGLLGFAPQLQGKFRHHYIRSIAAELGLREAECEFNANVYPEHDPDGLLEADLLLRGRRVIVEGKGNEFLYRAVERPGESKRRGRERVERGGVTALKKRLWEKAGYDVILIPPRVLEAELAVKVEFVRRGLQHIEKCRRKGEEGGRVEQVPV
jgi:hypothetical protein